MARVDQCKTRLEKIPAILKRFRLSTLAAACSGELTKDWRENNNEIDLGSDLFNRVQKKTRKIYLQEYNEAKKNGKRIPKKPPILGSGNISSDDEVITWGKLKLDYAFLPNDLFDGPFGSNLKTSDYADTGVRVIRLENIGFLHFIDAKKTFISEERYKKLIKHTVEENDILFASFISENVRTVVLPKIEKSIAKADCFCIRPINSLLNQKYLTFILSSPQLYSEMVKIIHGATRPRINTKQLKKIYIPLASMEEQNEIVHRVEALFSIDDLIEERYKKAKAYVNKLTQSILAKAFRGELVPQDPNDEPASVLLERIKAEKDRLEADIPERKKAARKQKPERGTTPKEKKIH